MSNCVFVISAVFSHLYQLTPRNRAQTSQRFIEHKAYEITTFSDDY